MNRLCNASLTILLCLLLANSLVGSYKIEDGVDTAKDFHFYLVTACVLILISLKTIVRKTSTTVELNALDLSFAAFLLYSALRLLTTSNASFTDEVFVKLSCGALLYTVLISALRRELSSANCFDGRMIIISFLAVGTIASVLGMLQIHGIDIFPQPDQDKLRGLFVDTNAYVGYLATVAPFGLGLYLSVSPFQPENRILRLFGGVAFLAALLVLPASMVGQACVAVLAGAFLIVSQRNEVWDKLRRVLWNRWSLIAIALLIGMSFVALHGTSGSLIPNSAAGQLLIWKVTARIVGQHPYLGIGYDRFRVAYDNQLVEYISGGDVSKQEAELAVHITTAQNEFLQITAEMGLVGLMIFCICWRNIFSGFHHGLHRGAHGNEMISQIMVSSSRASLLSVLVLSSLSSPLRVLPTFINFVFLLSVVSVFSHQKHILRVPISANWLRIGGVVSGCFGCLLLLSAYSLYTGYGAWQVGDDKLETMDYSGALREYESIRSQFGDNGRFQFKFGAALAQIGDLHASIKLLERAKTDYSDPTLWMLLARNYEMTNNHAKAEEHYLKVSAIIPHRLSPKYALVKLYQKIGRSLDARRMALKVLGTDVRIRSVAVDQIRVEMQRFLGQKEYENSEASPDSAK